MTKVSVEVELGEDIVTRPHGQRLNELIERALATGESVTVDFGGLQVTSVSFFDESFGALAKRIGQEEFCERVRFENIDPFDLALVNDIVMSRSREQSRAARKKIPRRQAHG